ncbi:MAG: hypothetical protein QOG73_2193, partial [Acetobacteraceae bacterium]|nr:hypothetical protein [Acetobacteraceae bacterium]
RQAARSTMAMPFRAVDVAKQAKAYRLEARGAEDGAANRPEPGSDTLALAEQEIVTAIGAERERCLIDLTTHLRAERDGLAQLQTAMDIAGMQHAAGEAISDFETINSRHAGALEREKRAAASALLEYDAFRQRNRISRDARQPTNRTGRERLAPLSGLHSFSHNCRTSGRSSSARPATARPAHSNAFVFGRNLLVGVVRQQRRRDQADDRAYQDINRDRQT